MNWKEELIFRYLDGECTDEEKVKVDSLRKKDKEFADLFSELKAANDLFSSQPLYKPSAQFTDGVMQQINPGKQFSFNSFSTVKILSIAMLSLVFLFSFQEISPRFLDNPVLTNLVNNTTLIYTVSLLFFFLLIDFLLIQRDGNTSEQ